MDDYGDDGKKKKWDLTIGNSDFGAGSWKVCGRENVY